MNDALWRFYSIYVRKLIDWSSRTHKRRFAARVYRRIAALQKN